MLHELVRYAEREGLPSERGFKAKSIRWLLNFDPEGRFVGLTDCTGGDRKSKGRLFKKCPDLGVLAQGGGVAHFLADSLQTVTLHDVDPTELAKFAKKHDYFVDLLRQASSTLPILAPIANELGVEASLAAICAELVARKAKAIDTASIQILDPSGTATPLLDDAAGSDWWRDHYGSLIAGDPAEAGATSSAVNMLCMLSGVAVDPAATHPKIESMSDVGGLSVGVSLASFDKEAFESYGLEKGRNAAMSSAQASIYTGALNDLLRNPARTKRLAGVKIVYWYAGVTTADADDVLADVIYPEGFEADDEDDDAAPASPREMKQAESRAGKLLEAIRSGERSDLRDARFYAMTISANAGRVVIRDWMEGTFVALAEAIDQWFADLAIVSRDGFNIVRHFKLLALVGAGVRDLKDAQPAMEMSLLRSAIQGRPIASEIAAQTLRRATLDIINGNTAQHRRFALLKAYLVRKGIKMTEETNEDFTDPAYLCGRLMAVLADIQRVALPEVGAGIVQRYYAAASATPGLVLGRLVRTAVVAHLPKFKKSQEGLRVYFEAQLRQIWNEMKLRPPATLTLEEQTLFAMGYYQQQAKRNKPKDDDASPATDA